MGEKEVVAWCLVQNCNNNIVMKVKKQQQQQQTVSVCMYDGVPRPEAGQAISGQVHCKVCHQ